MTTELEKKIAVLETKLAEHIKNDEEQRADMLERISTIKTDFQREIDDLKQEKDDLQRQFSQREFSKSNRIVTVLVNFLVLLIGAILSFFFTNIGGK